MKCPLVKKSILSLQDQKIYNSQLTLYINDDINEFEEKINVIGGYGNFSLENLAKNNYQFMLSSKIGDYDDELYFDITIKDDSNISVAPIVNGGDSSNSVSKQIFQSKKC